MRSVIVALLVWSGTTAAAVEPARSIVLVEDGRSPYVIVLAAEASPSEQHAARDLRHSLGGATGVEVPIVTEGQASALSAPRIFVGAGKLARERLSAGAPVDWEKLGDEGFDTFFGGSPSRAIAALIDMSDELPKEEIAARGCC